MMGFQEAFGMNRPKPKVQTDYDPSWNSNAFGDVNVNVHSNSQPKPVARPAFNYFNNPPKPTSQPILAFGQQSQGYRQGPEQGPVNMAYRSMQPQPQRPINDQATQLNRSNYQPIPGMPGQLMNRTTGNPLSLDRDDEQQRQMANTLVDSRMAYRKAVTPYQQAYSTGLGTGVAPVNADVYNQKRNQESAELEAMRQQMMANRGYKHSAHLHNTAPQQPVNPEVLAANRQAYEARQAERQAAHDQRVRFMRGQASSPEEAMQFAMMRASRMDPMGAMKSYGEGMDALGNNQTQLAMQGLRNQVENKRNEIEQLRVNGMISNDQARIANEYLINSQKSALENKNDRRLDEMHALDMDRRKLENRAMIAQNRPDVIASQAYSDELARSNDHRKATEAGTMAYNNAMAKWRSLGESVDQDVSQWQAPPNPATMGGDFKQYTPANPEDVRNLYDGLTSELGRKPTGQELQNALRARGMSVNQAGMREIVRRGTNVAPNMTTWDLMTPGLGTSQSAIDANSAYRGIAETMGQRPPQRNPLDYVATPYDTFNRYMQFLMGR